MAEVKEVKVYKANSYLINIKHLTDEQIEDAIRSNTYTFYDEGGCSKCDHLEYRHDETCDICPSFQGKRQLAKIVEKGEQRLLSLPFGATAKVRAFLRALDKPYVAVDRHPEPVPFSRPIRLLEHVKLRGYQKEAIEVMHAKKKGLIEAPPRSGKTLTAAAFITEIGCKTIIIASQREWLNQFMETFLGSQTAEAFTNARPRQIRFCKTFEEFEEADIALATPQQFMNERGKKLLERIRSLFTVLILDEAHLSPALQTSRVLAQFNTTYRIGLTATPDRKQRLLIEIVFDLIGPVIYKAEVERLVPRVEVLDTGIAFKLKPGGDFTRFINSIEYNKLRMQKIAKRVVTAVKDKHMVLVPVLRVRAIHALVRMINEEAERRIAGPFFGGMKKHERDKAVNDARTYKLPALVGNVKLLSTGLNIPRASCLLSSSLSNNLPNCEQRTARILTPYEGKPQPLLIYVLDDCDIMRRTARNEFWNVVHTKFKPSMTGQTRQHLMAWFAGKSGGGREGDRDSYQL